MITTIRRALVRTAAAVCFAASFAAQAAYYSSTWDPPSLVVNAIIKVDGCGTTPFVWANQGGCTASLFSTVATLNSVDGGPQLDPARYIDFIVPTGFYYSGSPAITDPNADDVILGLFFGPTGLTGILWNPFKFLGSNTAPREEFPNNLPHEGPWKLSFLNTPTAGDLYRSTALLWDCFHRHCSELEDTAVLQFQDFGDSELQFVPLGDNPPRLARDGSVIPEPGSLALIAGALSAGWITRRRRPVG
jgi:hypothetical protein